MLFNIKFIDIFLSHGFFLYRPVMRVFALNDKYLLKKKGKTKCVCVYVKDGWCVKLWRLVTSPIGVVATMKTCSYLDKFIDFFSMFTRGEKQFFCLTSNTLDVQTH